MSEQKIHRLWKPIGFADEWRAADTSILDDLSSAWFARRAKLRLDSGEFQGFLGRLKREHAIETGVVERLYDIDRGVTETLIQKGFIDGLLSHGDANIPSDQLMRHLNDHLEAMDFVFDLIKENRPLTVGFIRDLHQLVTRSQDTAEGRDSQGNKTRIKLLKGKYKEWENNPTRSDGTVILYCPPIQVASEMEQLVNIYHALEEEKVHPLIIAGWVHHAFTTIHPFQDGNGRVVRLLASLILIKHELFPITVLREEAKLKYILALEKADAGEPSDLVSYFAVIQKRQIERALNVDEVGSESLEEVENLLAQRINKLRNLKLEEQQKQIEIFRTITTNRDDIFQFAIETLSQHATKLSNILGESATVKLSQPAGFVHKLSVEDLGLAKYSETHQQLPLAGTPAAIIRLHIELNDLQLGYSFWSILYQTRGEEGVLAIGCYHRSITSMDDSNPTNLHFEIPPHLISILDSAMLPKHKNLSQYLEQSLTMALTEMYKLLH